MDGKHVWERIIDLGRTCKAPDQVSIELQPHWHGYLLVDSDTISVGSHKEKLLLSGDVYSQDIPHASLVECEDAAAWIEFFTALKDQVRYPLRGLIADGDPAIETARLKGFFPRCSVPALRAPLRTEPERVPQIPVHAKTRILEKDRAFFTSCAPAVVRMGYRYRHQLSQCHCP